MTSTIGADHRPYESQADPYTFYRRARREEPVFFSPQFDAWVVTSYDDVREVLANPDVYSLATVLRSLQELVPEALEELQRAIPPLPEDHAEPGDEARKRARPAIQQAFTPERVAAIEDHLRTQVSALVDRFAAGGPGDLMSRLARKLPVYGKARVLGLEAQDIETVVEGSYSLTYLMSGSASLSPAEQVENARRVAGYQRLLDTYAQRRREEPADDLFTAVVEAVAPHPGPLEVFERKTVVESMAGLIGAGQSTTTAVIGSGIWHLTEHRDQWELLRARPELAPNAVEEILRYDMPLQGLLRTTTRPVRLGGHDLPEGALLMVMFASANRDEAVFPDPDRLDITRPVKRHFSFGHGPRGCVGKHLARKLLHLTLLDVSAKLPGLRPAGDMTFVPGFHRILRRLDVTW
ncbi:cytochrome P450 [Dactylosporangium sp. AC04546]|uniref:cytochrome P450 n=1 Tax=Dactylosporangium sp. AC04546 TaxID=2862460 RepID=UPI001EE0CFAA|nr:cytochrome P450 [Dactylosporangium sp. AC04546]WVK79047.1 cytochrome P450 [Dactylosporangium sp. AC04546]